MGEGRSVLGQLGGPRRSPQDPPPAGSAVAPGARVPGRVSGPLLGGGRARVGGWCPPDHDSPVPSGRTQQFVRPRTCFVKRVFLRDASYAERWAACPPTACGPCRPCRGRRGTSPPRSWSPLWGGCELSAPGRSSGTGKDVGVPGRSGSPSRNHWGDPSDRGQGCRPGLPGRARPAAPAPDTPAPHPGAVRGRGVRSPRLPVKARPTPSRLPDVPLLDSVAPRREAGCTGGFSLRVSPARVGRGVTHASRAEASVRHTGTWREGRVRGTARAGTLARAPPAWRLRPAGGPGAPRWPDAA